MSRRFAPLLTLGLLALAGLMALQSTAHAAGFLEKNFWLSGPRYDGDLPDCTWALGTVSDQFAEKEKRFWNSALQIVGYDNIHEKVLRPWQSNNIPRRYCTARAMVSDGVARTVVYSIIEDGAIAGTGTGVEWCVVGLDRDWAYNPACRSARP
jgi:hypothetical protein